MSLPTERTSDHRRLLGILCTYRRPSEALSYLDRLETQTRCPDLVVVVDNDGDESLATAIAMRPRGRMTVEYLRSEENIGPAGAFRLGFDSLAKDGAPTDLVIHFDDDDPPVIDTQIERLTATLIAQIRADPSVAGIGCSGGTLNRRTGLVSKSDASEPLAEVDHLHGGYLPIYEMEALAAIGGQDASYFFGFEELELGRRLVADNRRLIVDNTLMREVHDLYPKKAATTTSEGAWSRFHKERNLVRILRRERLWSAIAFTCLFRHILKPVTTMPRRPRQGWQRLVLGLQATAAGFRDSGGIDSRYAPPA